VNPGTSGAGANNATLFLKRRGDPQILISRPEIPHDRPVATLDIAGQFVATVPLNRVIVEPISEYLTAPSRELSHHNTVRARMNLLGARPASEDIVPELTVTAKAFFVANLNEKGAASAPRDGEARRVREPRIVAVVITGGGEAFAGVLTIGLTAASLD